MHSAIAWSHDLLSREEQTLFRRLAVFVGGFTLEAAEAVAHDSGIEVFAGVEALADQSLLRPLGGDTDPRFAMFETVREFGLAQLEASGEAPETRRRHAEHFLELTRAVEPQLRRAEQGGWLARLEAEHDNLRAALSWGLAVDTGMALHLAGNLHWFWYLRGHWSEGRRWLEDALVRGDATTRTAARMKALAGAGILAFALGDHIGARDRLGESVAIGRSFGDRPARPMRCTSWRWGRSTSATVPRPADSRRAWPSSVRRGTLGASPRRSARKGSPRSG